MDADMVVHDMATGAATRDRADALGVCALHGSRASFNKVITTHTITPYSEFCTHHPSRIVVTNNEFETIRPQRTD